MNLTDIANCGRMEKNQKSAIKYPDKVQAYTDEEIELGALKGPFESYPIPAAHMSPLISTLGAS